jgi:hypothetical protein
MQVERNDCSAVTSLTSESVLEKLSSLSSYQHQLQRCDEKRRRQDLRHHFVFNYVTFPIGVIGTIDFKLVALAPQGMPIYLMTCPSWTAGRTTGIHYPGFLPD